MQKFVGKTGLLSEQGFKVVADTLGSDPCSLWALVNVETKGFGFLPNRQPKILFERHVFHGLTKGRFDDVDSNISSAERGGYFGGAGEYTRLQKAMELDRKSALGSASWGLGQIMGYHATELGYADVDAMVDAFCDGEDAQLDGVLRFINQDKPLHAALRSNDWITVARHYNGADFGSYPDKLRHSFEEYTRDGMPSIKVRAAQARLSRAGFDPHGIDGILGSMTKDAIAAFQRAKSLPVTGQLDDRTSQELVVAAGF
jgi:hypothetical protein